ncbi:MAG: hypothetical protein JXB62_08770 [Pirellulales bacterium]|nr:hypothetical protein [Pirellulales bacterium]
MGRATKKKRSAVLPPGLGKLLSFVVGRGRPIVLTGLAVLALVGAWCGAWYGAGVRQYVLCSGEYLVTPRSVILSQPDWIHTDIRAEVFRSASLDGPLSIMDDDLAQRISDAFSLHPWVAKVQRVQKHHPARVEVELVFRRPVCMVAVPGGLFPIDVHGVLLPVGDFSSVEASRYPRLTDIDTLPLGTVGESWGDPRVVGGAEIAAALEDVWHELRLSHLVPSARSPAAVAEEHTYTLVTRGGTHIHWGWSPGSDVPGELSAADKIARLRKYVAEHGTLEGHDGPQALDVHQLQVPRISSRPRP